MSEKIILALTVAGCDLTFEPTTTAYNQLTNESVRTQNVAGAIRDYLLKIVAPDSRAALLDILKKPGAPEQLAKFINDRFAPELEIELKV
ncbi:TPA: hypothetical protein LVL19_003591 [Klebsiella michiganensis]|nr:hypothetical protein [Klebsiella michiganensis]